ncbi:MAG: molecular chaperone HtpG [Alloprevotella sp.]|nr:molecular chaperone HtpG [Alloprevotella sp.]
MQKGNIGITTENIFPIIKKFLYSDHEIFLREVVANAVDATQKLKTLASTGNFKGELGDLTIRLSLDKEAGTLTISDRGIGMTAEEVDKYINQIAFSGANDFLEKYKDDANAIIGHFGLGFYSTFMVAKRVDIITRSYQDGAKAVKWTCDGSPSYELDETDKADRGTDIVLHIDDDCKDFLEKSRIDTLLNKYCRFLPVAIAFGKKQEWKDGKYEDTEADNIVNETNPLWTKQPSTLKDEDYKKFYQSLYPMNDEPLFWIHLNVDFPFHLTGVLYFPKIKNNIDIRRNLIQLYCNQVFVTDQVENIVPDFLTLLHGIIDSPDIPLNVSRSYLQSDANVKKISSYITKKVADKLAAIFKTDRNVFEEKWEDLKLFIHYGMLSDEDFYAKAKDFMLLQDVDGKHYTLDEYKTLTESNQKDKDEQLVWLYAQEKDAQYSYIETAQKAGYNVLLFDGQLDTPLVQLLEQKLEKTRFSRVDSDTIDRLIQKADAAKSTLSDDDDNLLRTAFESVLPKQDKINFHVETAAGGQTAAPLLITQSEYMRRMKESARFQPGMSFYGEMPDMYSLVLNTDNALIGKIVDALRNDTSEDLKPIVAELKGLRARHAALEQQQENGKDDAEDIKKTREEAIEQAHADIEEQEKKRTDIVGKVAKENTKIAQLIDLALLQNGLLKGEALSRFINRSTELL